MKEENSDIPSYAFPLLLTVTSKRFAEVQYEKKEEKKERNAIVLSAPPTYKERTHLDNENSEVTFREIRECISKQKDYENYKEELKTFYENNNTNVNSFGNKPRLETSAVECTKLPYIFSKVSPAHHIIHTVFPKSKDFKNSPTALKQQLATTYKNIFIAAAQNNIVNLQVPLGGAEDYNKEKVKTKHGKGSIDAISVDTLSGYHAEAIAKGIRQARDYLKKQGELYTAFTNIECHIVCPEGYPLETLATGITQCSEKMRKEYSALARTKFIEKLEEEYKLPVVCINTRDICRDIYVTYVELGSKDSYGVYRKDLRLELKKEDIDKLLEKTGYAHMDLPKDQYLKQSINQQNDLYKDLYNDLSLSKNQIKRCILGNNHNNGPIPQKKELQPNDNIIDKDFLGKQGLIDFKPLQPTKFINKSLPQRNDRNNNNIDFEENNNLSENIDVAKEIKTLQELLTIASTGIKNQEYFVNVMMHDFLESAKYKRFSDFKGTFYACISPLLDANDFIEAITPIFTQFEPSSPVQKLLKASDTFAGRNKIEEALEEYKELCGLEKGHAY